MKGYILSRVFVTFNTLRQTLFALADKLGTKRRRLTATKFLILGFIGHTDKYLIDIKSSIKGEQ